MFVDEGLGLPTGHAFVFGAALLKPASRGKVFLRSLLPSAKPHIVHGYFTDPADRQTMTRALGVLANIAAQPALTAHRRAPMRVPASGSDADIWEFIKRECQTLYHPKHVRYRLGGRPAATGARPGGAARGGRFRHAHGDQGEHQRTDHHDRGKGSRPDPLRLNLASCWQAPPRQRPAILVRKQPLSRSRTAAVPSPRPLTTDMGRRRPAGP
jgi:hypothetical protein